MYDFNKVYLINSSCLNFRWINPYHQCSIIIKDPSNATNILIPVACSNSALRRKKKLKNQFSLVTLNSENWIVLFLLAQRSGLLQCAQYIFYYKPLYISHPPHKHTLLHLANINTWFCTHLFKNLCVYVYITSRLALRVLHLSALDNMYFVCANDDV